MDEQNRHPALAALAAALAADAAEHARVKQATAFARAWAAVGEALL